MTGYLFTEPPVGHVVTIEDRFLAFHHTNPQVYSELVSQARILKSSGCRCASIALLYERLRWLHFIATKGEEEFKLNNDFRALYARLIMDQETDLDGFFKTRKRAGEDE